MKVKINAEALGDIAVTKKGGFIRQFLTIDALNQKCVIKVYSENRVDLENNGPRVVETDDFCFAPKA